MAKGVSLQIKSQAEIDESMYFLYRECLISTSGIYQNSGQLGTGKAFLRFVLHGFPKKSKRLGTGKAFLGFVLPGFHKPFGNLGTGKLTSSLFSLVDQMNVVH